MSNNTRKIVVLNNLNSPQIEQAIFILRDEALTSETDALSEAQKIVDCYVKSLESPSDQVKAKATSKFRSFIGIVLYTFATAVLTAYLLPLIR